jgi:hypothetical protein
MGFLGIHTSVATMDSATARDGDIRDEDVVQFHLRQYSTTIWHWLNWDAIRPGIIARGSSLVTRTS